MSESDLVALAYITTEYEVIVTSRAMVELAVKPLFKGWN
jgi:hypothetical protein